MGADGALVDPLDRRNELHPTGADLVAQKAVDRERGLGVGAVDGDEDVGLDPVPLQKTQAAHDAVEGRPPAFVPAVSVVNLPGAVEADPHEKVVRPQEGAPLVREQGAVGLQGVLEAHPRPAVGLLERDGAPEKIDSHEGRLAALPGHRQRVAAVGRNQLGDVAFQHLVAHAKATAGVEAFFLEIKAVGAVQVAG